MSIDAVPTLLMEGQTCYEPVEVASNVAFHCHPALASSDLDSLASSCAVAATLVAECVQAADSSALDVSRDVFKRSCS